MSSKIGNSGPMTRWAAKAYYLARMEVQIPLGLGSQQSLACARRSFTDVGAVWNVAGAANLVPVNGPTTNFPECAPYNGATAGFREEFLGNSAKPRLSVGIGVNWNSPFGPFRFDLAKALLTQPGDNPQLFQFNVGTQF
jgi:outer membrane protein insertion porin family